LEAAVRRARSEPAKPVPPERAALIKVWLNRALRDPAESARLTNENIHFQELMTTMNEGECNRGYLLGRLFACVERMQELALGEVGASVTDRYFAAACATPQAAFPRLLKMEIHHYRKARDGGRASTARWLHRQIDDIAAALVSASNGLREGESIEGFMRRSVGRPLVGFPSFLPLPEQGLFTLGYHQQRAALFTKRPSAEVPDEKACDAPEASQSS
jgi:CRISPR-associated protein Csd1